MVKKKSVEREVIESEKMFSAILEQMANGSEPENFGVVRAAKELANHLIRLQRTVDGMADILGDLNDLSLDDLAVDIAELRTEIASLQGNMGFLIGQTDFKKAPNKPTKKKSASKKKSR